MIYPQLLNSDSLRTLLTRRAKLRCPGLEAYSIEEFVLGTGMAQTAPHQIDCRYPKHAFYTQIPAGRHEFSKRTRLGRLDRPAKRYMWMKRPDFCPESGSREVALYGSAQEPEPRSRLHRNPDHMWTTRGRKRTYTTEGYVERY